MRVYYGKTSGKIISLDGKRSKYVIWGDWLDVKDHPDDALKHIVNWRAWDARTKTARIDPYVVKKSDCQADALLEMIFLDVGQGDGCIVNVPTGAKQRTMVIDAGQRGNMHGFLDWRFRNVDENCKFDTAVITHPDADHYLGFRPIFDDKRIHFEQIFHNGLVERDAAKEDKIGRRENGLCTEIFDTRAKLKTFLDDAAVRGRTLYANLLWSALEHPDRFGEIAMASTKHGEKVEGRTYLPGYAPDDADTASIEILGPVPEKTNDGRLALRAFGEKPRDGKFDLGKTKNGHSVLLKLRYRGFSVIFGGDLNRPSEDYLLRHYGEIDDQAPLATAVAKAGKRFAADLLKCCHHGSADVTDEFLEAVQPFAFVLSSGDEESHVHPRPEILGLLGKKGRSERPLVLCTEILRSTPESKRLSDKEKDEVELLMDAVANAPAGEAKKLARRKLSDFWNRRFARLVNVYGAINIRTDGRELIVGFLKEKRGSGSPWQLYKYAIRNGEWKGVELKSGGH